MKLLTKEILKRLPPLYTNEGLPSAYDAVAQVKFFGGGRWTWYATEYDGEDTFFGYVISGLGEAYDELGYFSLKELTEMRFPPFGLPIERDLHFDPKPLREELRERWGRAA